MKRMFVYGKGFLAKALKKLKNNNKFNNFCFYASGISNSKIKSNTELIREKKKIKSFLRFYPPNKTLVYISTISIFDTSMKNTGYVKNKLFIENFLKSNVKKLLILRLPQIAGKSNNEYTI